MVSGEPLSSEWFVIILVLSSCSPVSMCASSIFPTVRAVNKVLTWVFTSRACA